MWFLGPVLTAIVFYMLPILRSITKNPSLIRNITPFGVILLVWIVIFLVKARREFLTIQKMIDGLSVSGSKTGLGEG